MAYLPGTEGGAGVADVLFGKVNPSGHLPVTWPSDAPTQQSGFNPQGPSTLGDEPKFFDQLPGTNSGWGSGYNPLYPFGFGLSYTTFSTSGLGVTQALGRTDTAVVTFAVTNTGGRDGTDVVPVYVHQPTSSDEITVPDRRLVGFARVTVPAGQSRSVTVKFPVSKLAVTPGDIQSYGRPQVQPGAYQVQVDTLTAGFTVQ
jgi:beta-glucosidase